MLGATEAVAESASVTQETIFQSDRYQPRKTVPLGAGASGVLYSQEGRNGYLWTGWNGRSRNVDLGGTVLKGGSYGDVERSWLPAGTDILVHAAGADGWAREDLGTGARITFALPQGHTFVAAAGPTLLTRTGQAGTYAHHLLTIAADGTWSARVDVSAPAGTTVSRQLAADAKSLVVEYAGPDRVAMIGMIDLMTGAFDKGRVMWRAVRSQIVLTPARLVLTDGLSVRWVPRSDLGAPAIDLGVSRYANEKISIAADGDHLLLGGDVPQEPDDYADVSGSPVRRVGFDGAAPVTLYRHGETVMVTAADGRAVFAAGADSSHWALRKGSDGGAPTEVAAVEGVPARINKLSLANGQLATREADGVFFEADFTRPIIHDGTAYRPGKRVYEDWSYGNGVTSTGDGRAVFTESDTIGSEVNSVQKDDDAGFFRTPPSTQGTLLDVTGRYAIVNGTNPVGQYVGDLGVYQDLNAIRSRTSVTAASVWGYTYWTQTATAGQVVGEDLRTGTKSTLTTGARCVAKELQAVGRWLYWTCGPNGPAGVYDRTAKKNIAVPSGEALVGDGYLVRHDKSAGKLLLTAFRDGSAVTRTVGDLAGTAENQRGVTWSVDKFGGPLAYVAADRRIHLVPSGVATEPFSFVQSTVTDYQRVLYGEKWRPRWVPSKPAGAWQLTLRDATTGTAVRTLTGRGDGRTAGTVSVTWDGRDDLGRGVKDGTYSWMLTAAPGDGVGTPITQSGSLKLYGSAVTTLSGTYEALAPTRTLDTRTGLGAPKAKVGAGKAVSLKVAGVAGVPASGITAVALNVTATNATSATHVTVYPSGRPKPYASNLNVTAGLTVANAVVVPVVDGKVNLHNFAGSVDLLADVAGYYVQGKGGSAYRSVTPERLMDTRSALGVPKAPVGAQGTVTLQIAGRGGVPAHGATAVVLNVTATSPTRSTYVTAYPSGTPRGSSSTLNVPAAGRTVANLVTVPLVDGKVSFYNHAGSVDLLADVAGYFTDDEAAGGAAFIGVGPDRGFDTRTANDWTRGKIGPGETVTWWASGFPGVPAKGVRAVVLNLTVTNPRAAGYVSAFPAGERRPSVSSVNFIAGQTVPNLVVVPMSEDGKISFYNHSGSTDLIADVVGYYGS
ncbi:FlgD immunoglobulin-like domain containing protein [Streptomyces sp. NPDC126499]|uniref:FlgD immunoglobulin-like domain containing protein n=1 Tax=Streptomyces sp. NPDC126499 TaxID=3155314 RepID=UPI0033202AF1